MMYLKAVTKTGHTRHIFSCDSFTVSRSEFTAEELTEDVVTTIVVGVQSKLGPINYNEVVDVVILTTGDKVTHHLMILDKTMTIFVMNENGKTIDRI